MADKIVTVFGATGLQGGSVARALQAGGMYRVRAVTRNPESDAAKKLREIGAEVVKADIDDKASLVKVLAGAYGCFGVTNFWEHMNKEKETQQGLNIVKACREAGVKHLIYSGVENVKREMGFEVPHFDGKGEVEDYLKNSDIPFTSVRLAAYTENFLSYFVPQKIGEGKYALFVPMGDMKWPLIRCSEVGECVHQIFKRRDEFLGKFVGLAGYEQTVAEIAKILSTCLGKDIADGKMTADAYAKLGFPGAQDLANMFKFYCSGKCVRDIKLTNELNPKMSSLQDWVTANKEAMLKSMPQ